MVHLKLENFDSVLDVSRHRKDNAEENNTQCKRIFDELIRLVFEYYKKGQRIIRRNTKMAMVSRKTTFYWKAFRLT